MRSDPRDCTAICAISKSLPAGIDEVSLPFVRVINGQRYSHFRKMLQPLSTDTVTQASPLAGDVPITVDVDCDPASKLTSIPPDYFSCRRRECSTAREHTSTA